MKLISLRGNPLLKFFDRYAGIPVVFILGMFRDRKRRKPATDDITNAAFLMTAAIGDTVLLSAAISDFKLRLPGSKLTLFAGMDNYEISKNIRGIDRLIMIHPAKPVIAIKKIRAEGIFDALYDFGSWARLNAVFTFFSNAKYKIGFKTEGQHRHYVYDEYALHSGSSHEYQNYKKLLRLTGIAGNSLPELAAGEKPGKQNDLVIIHMFPGGSRSYLKEWDDDKWAGVINHITGMNFSVYLTGAPKDRERALNIFNRINNKNLVFVAAGEYNLRQTIDLIASAGLVITVDTGILHIASAAGANLIALHGPTSSGRWGALNRNSISFESGLDCAPCISLGFESKCKNNRCMKEISVENILNAVIKFIPERQAV